MRVLVVTQYFWPENFRVNDLVQGLCERGHQVTVLTGIPNYPGGRLFSGYGYFSPLREHYAGAEVIRVPLISRGGGGAIRLALNYFSFALAASVLGPLRCRGKFDAIFVHEPSPITVGLPAVVMKKIKHAPIYFWVLDLWPESLAAAGSVRAPWLLRTVEGLVRWIYRHCDRLLMQSRGFFAHAEHLGVEPQRLRYFPNWAEKLYRPVEPGQDVPAICSALPDGFRVMFAGNVGVAQDFPTLLSAAEKLKCFPDVHWVIVGEGRMSAWVSLEIERRGLGKNVHLLGHHAPDVMPPLFAQADVMLVSLKRESIFELTVPAKLQAYLACGRPVIGALEGEGARIINEAKAGVACLPEDPEALVQAVLKLYQMTREERVAMGAAGRAYYEANFEREMLFDQLEQWLHEPVD